MRVSTCMRSWLEPPVLSEGGVNQLGFGSDLSPARRSQTSHAANGQQPCNTTVRHCSMSILQLVLHRKGPPPHKSNRGERSRLPLPARPSQPHTHPMASSRYNRYRTTSPRRFKK